MHIAPKLYKTPKTPRKMRKKHRGVALLCVLAVFLLFPMPAIAEPSDTSLDVKDWLERLREALPPAIAEQVALDSVEDTSEMIGIPYLFSLVSASLQNQLPSALGIFTSFCGLALLGAVSSLLCEGLKGERVKKSISSAVTMVIALVSYAMTEGVITRAAQVLSDMADVSKGLLPVMTAVYVAGGNYTTAVTQSGTMTLMLTISQQMTVQVLLPVSSVCFAFALLGALGTGVDTESLARSMRQIYMTLMGFLTAIFSASLALQTTLSASSDSVALRTAKYAVGQMLPTVGSTIGATLSTLATSMSLIKSTVGAGGVGILLMLLLPPVVELYLFSLAFSLARAFCGLLHFSAGAKLFGDCKGVFDMVLGVMTMTGVMLILSIGIFMKCSLAVS